MKVAASFTQLSVKTFMLFSFLTKFHEVTSINSGDRFAYERGSCDIAISSVFRDILKSEVRAIMQPWYRTSKHKLLRYDLYTPHNPEHAQILRNGDADGLRASHFQSQWPVRVLIHGWTGKSTTCSNAALKDAYMENNGKFNVIVVDWSKHSLDISYTRITQQIPDIGATLTSFLRFINEITGAPFEGMYLIGHSAGSHIAGWAGKHLWPDRYGAIFGLDPAGLTHLGVPKSQRLAPSDALYVETIHSDTTMLGNPSVRLGHAAFFPNWAQGQPHCPNATAVELEFTCDHYAALYYFAISVRQSRAYGAVRCTAKSANDANNNVGSGDGGVGGRGANADISRGNDPSNAFANAATNIDDYACGCTRPVNQETTLTDAKIAAQTGPTTTFDCPADVFMGGEPAVTSKRGVYYFSTTTRYPYSLGATVRISPPAPSSVLRTGRSSNRASNIGGGIEHRLPLPFSIKLLKLGLLF